MTDLSTLSIGTARGLNNFRGLIPLMGLAERIQEAIEGSQEPGAPVGTPKTKAQIARECGVTGSALSQWLSGSVKSLKAETALALEQATGYRANWILSGKGPRKMGESAPFWPFPKIDMERFTKLDAGDRGYVERKLLQAIIECEGDAAAPPQAARRAIDLPETQITPVRPASAGKRRA